MRTPIFAIENVLFKLCSTTPVAQLPTPPSSRSGFGERRVRVPWWVLTRVTDRLVLPYSAGRHNQFAIEL